MTTLKIGLNSIGRGAASSHKALFYQKIPMFHGNTPYAILIRRLTANVAKNQCTVREEPYGGSK